MCEVCGCGAPTTVAVDVHENILAGNNREARHNREHFEAGGVWVVNLMGSPGSGKTALLEATAGAAGPSLRIGAIAGDLETDRDANRLRAAGIPSVALNTKSACHLDAKMVHRALHHVDWHGLDCLFIENVGNLVCPAVYDLGQAANVVALAVTEGDDKPLKYPVMFRKADLVLITKADLLPHLPDVRIETILEGLALVNPEPEAFPVSARSGLGIDRWLRWLETRGRRERFAPMEAAGGPV